MPTLVEPFQPVKNMYGIYGVITRQQLSPDLIEKTRDMASFLRHRGPEGSGEYIDKSVLIGMRRLSIIDLEGGWQPLYNEDRSLALVANGEVYSFVELRKELQDLNHQFHTGSDCETILHLYEDYGENCLKYLPAVEIISGFYT